jgi:hypothetical protein
MNEKIQRIINIYKYLPEVVLKFQDTDEYFIEELCDLKNLLTSGRRIQLAYNSSCMRHFIGINVEEELIKAATEEMLRQFNIEKA